MYIQEIQLCNDGYTICIALIAVMLRTYRKKNRKWTNMGRLKGLVKHFLFFSLKFFLYHRAKYIGKMKEAVNCLEGVLFSKQLRAFSKIPPLLSVTNTVETFRCRTQHLPLYQLYHNKTIGTSKKERESAFFSL